MSKTPEGHVKGRVREILDGYQGMWYYMPVPSGYGRQVIDFIGCFRGMFFAIETKAQGKKPTALQEQTLREISVANGATFVIVGDNPTGIADLVAWLNKIQRTVSYVSLPSPPPTRPTV